MDLKQALLTGATAAILALATGKMLRRLLLLPFKKIVEKTQNREEALLLDEAVQDLGLDATAGVPVPPETKPATPTGDK